MKYIKFTYVDSVTGVSVARQPAENGPTFPPLPGLEFVWARESRYPTAVPEFFGTCPDESDTQIEGVLGVYLQADWETTGTAAAGPTASDAIGVLADLLEESDRLAGIYAQAADLAHAAGITCERAADALIAP